MSKEALVLIGGVAFAILVTYVGVQRRQDTIWCVDMTKISHGRAILAVAVLSDKDPGFMDCLTMDMSGHAVKSDLCQQMVWSKP